MTQSLRFLVQTLMWSYAVANPVNLFPARVPFVNQDGTLTAEAYRALNALLNRVGGMASNAVPSSTDLETIFGAFVSEAAQELSLDAVQTIPASPETIENFALVAAPENQEIPVIQLQTPQDQLFDTLVYVGGNRAGLPIQTATVTASPFTYTAKFDCGLVVSGGTVSLIEYIRQGTTVPVGTVLNVSENDQIKITYTVAPTVYIIPR